MDYRFYGKQEFINDCMKMNREEFNIHCIGILEYIVKVYKEDGKLMPIYKYVSAARWRVINYCDRPGGATKEDCAEYNRIYDAVMRNENKDKK